MKALEKTFSRIDVRTLMADAVLNALIVINRDEKLKDSIESVLSNPNNNIFEKWIFIDTVMSDAHDALIDHYLEGDE